MSSLPAALQGPVATCTTIAAGAAALVAGALLPSVPLSLAALPLLAGGLFGQWLLIRRAEAALSAATETRDDLLAVFESAELGLAWLSPEGNFMRVNSVFAARAGVPPEQLVGVRAASLATSSPKEQAEFEQLQAGLGSGELESYCLTRPYRTGPDSQIWTRATVKAMRPTPEAPATHVLIVSQNVTAEVTIAQTLQARTQSLRDNEARLQAIFDHAPVGIGYFSVDGLCLLANRRLATMVQQPVDAIVGHSWRPLARQAREADLVAAQTMRAELIAGKRQRFSVEMLVSLPDGSRTWRRVTGALVPGSEGDVPCLINIIEDIDELKRAEAAARQAALYDPLTGLPNRRLLLDRLEHTLGLSRRSRRHGAVIFIDLDNFKHLNDARGHHVGDRLLQELANRLQGALRDQDTVARLGGDEFVVLIEGLPRDRDAAIEIADRVAGKLRQALALPFELGPSDYIPSASLGVTLFSQEPVSCEELLKQADAAMYRAKQTRNAVCFYAADVQAAAEHRLQIERDLHGALEKGEFRLALQPKFTADGTPAGAEVLLRWQHPQLGPVSPAEFIPIAEESGLIVGIGQWVLREACELLRGLSPRLGPSLAVNVSPRQFKDPHFVEWLAALLGESGIDPGRLTLEITEGLVMQLGEDIYERLNQIHALGVRVSIDDFGTGYSSLAYLKRLPLNELKIDHAFIADLPHDQNGVAVVDAILSMASHLNLDVVAEGVETQAQLQFLKARGCRQFQGFLLGRPEPVADFMARLQVA